MSFLFQGEDYSNVDRLGKVKVLVVGNTGAWSWLPSAA